MITDLRLPPMVTLPANFPLGRFRWGSGGRVRYAWHLDKCLLH
jgi:hypothetical protein